MDKWANVIQGGVSMSRCHLTSTEITIIKIRQSHDHVILIMGNPIPGKSVFILGSVMLTAWPSVLAMTMRYFTWNGDITKCLSLLFKHKRPVGLYSSAAYWNHDDQGKGSSSELDMSEYIMFGLDWVCLTTTRPSGHISRRINNVWPMLRQWSFSWSFQDVCLAVLYVRKG